MKSITISGELTHGEFVAIVALIRSFDDAAPDRVIAITVDDPHSDISDAERALHEAFPEQEGRRTVIRRMWGQPK